MLILVTSHDRLGSTGTATGFWLDELSTPYYELLDAGVGVEIASPRGGVVPVDPKSEQQEWQTDSTRRFMADVQAMGWLMRTLKVAGVRGEDYDAVYLAGGHGTMWDFPTDESLTRLLEALDAAGKPIASVCHGVAALVPLKDAQGRSRVAGRRITAFTDSEELAVQLEKIVPFLLESRLRELGARFEAGPDWAAFAVRDGNLITGQNPASAALTIRALVEAVRESSAGQAVQTSSQNPTHA